MGSAAGCNSREARTLPVRSAGAQELGGGFAEWSSPVSGKDLEERFCSTVCRITAQSGSIVFVQEPHASTFSFSAGPREQEVEVSPPEREKMCSNDNASGGGAKACGSDSES